METDRRSSRSSRRRSYQPERERTHDLYGYEEHGHRPRARRRHSMNTWKEEDSYSKDDSALLDYYVEDRQQRETRDVRRSSSLRHHRRRKTEIIYNLKSKSKGRRSETAGQFKVPGPANIPVARHADRSTDESDCESNKDDLLKYFWEVKTDMYRIVEEELRLKVEMRSVKEQFLDLLRNLEAFEHQEENMQACQESVQASNHWPQQSLASDQGNASNCPPAPYQSMADGNGSAWTFDGYPVNVINTSEPGLLERDSEVRLPGFDNPDKSLRDISEITKYSQNSIREQFSQSNIDATGPLQSTMEYPQHSTPEHIRKMRESEIQDASSSYQMEELGARPTPTGTDNRYIMAMVQAQHPSHGMTTPQRGYRYNTSSTDSTPIVCNPRFPMRNKFNPRASSDSGTYCGDSSPTVVNSSKDMSRSRFLMLGDSSDQSSQGTRKNRSGSSTQSNDSAQSMRRQRAQSDLDSDSREPVGLSDTDFMDPSLDAQSVFESYSMEATRDTAPDFSNLSTSPAEAIKSDITSSSQDDSPISGQNESSYKESDGTWDSHASSKSDTGVRKATPSIRSTVTAGHSVSRSHRKRHRGFGVGSARPVTHGSSFGMPSDNCISRWTSTDGSTSTDSHAPIAHPVTVRKSRYGIRPETSLGASSAECKPGFFAPMNSPNVTTDMSLSSHPTQDSKSSLEMLDMPPTHNAQILGARPPCIGGDGFNDSLQPNVPHLPIPNALAVAQGSSKSLEAELELAGTTESSVDSNCSNSSASNNNDPGVMSLVSGEEGATASFMDTPPSLKNCANVNVKKSLSHRFKKLIKSHLKNKTPGSKHNNSN